MQIALELFKILIFFRYRLIEEFMLLANTLVAEHLKTHFPTTAMLRNHAPPDPAPMEKAAKFLKAHGIEIDFTSAGSIQKSKALYCQSEESDHRHFDVIINNILSKPMVVRNKYNSIMQKHI